MTSTTRPRCTPSTITRTLPLGSFRFWMTVATTPRSQMSSRSGSSIRGSFWAARKIRLLEVESVCSSARTELSRPTMKGAIMWGNTTMSRRGTRGRISRFLVMNCELMVPFRSPACRTSPGKAFPASSSLLERDRLGPARDDILVDQALLDVALRGDGVHEVEHQFLENDAQAAGADVSLQRLLGDRHHGFLGELELHPFELEDGLVLANEAVLRLLEDAHQRLLVELLERRDDRQAADELGDQPVLDEVLGEDVLQRLRGTALLLALDVGPEAQRLLVHPPRDDLLQSDEGAAADEQDVGGVDLQALLVRVLAAALGRHVALRPLEDLQERLLHSLARDVAGDRRVVALATDFVHLVDVDDAALGLLLVVARGLVELQDDVLDVLADVPGFGQSGGIGDGEGDGEKAGQGLRQQCLSRSCGADEQDVRLLELDLAVRLLGKVDALVVVVDGDRELLLGLLLADDVLIQQRFDFLRLRQVGVLLLLQHPVLGDDVETDVDTFVADEDRGTGDQFLDLPLALVAERAPQDLVAAVFLRHFSSVVRTGGRDSLDARSVPDTCQLSCWVEQGPRFRLFRLVRQGMNLRLDPHAISRPYLRPARFCRSLSFNSVARVTECAHLP